MLQMKKPAHGGLGEWMDQRDAVKRSIAYAEAREYERKQPFHSPGWMDGAVPLGAVLLVVGAVAAVALVLFGLFGA